jgi:hypothetical protein
MIQLDERVMSLIRECTTRQEVREDGVFVGDTESGFLVVRAAEGFEIRPWHRGRFGAAELTGATQDVVEAYLAWEFGGTWRLLRGWSLLDLGPDDTLPPGIAVTREPDGRDGVLIEGTPPVHARGITRGLGAKLAHVIPVPLGDLVASMRHPDGLPAFPQRGPRPAGRS